MSIRIVLPDGKIAKQALDGTFGGQLPLAGWGYRKKITIAGTADGALTNYPMKVYIHRTTGSDSDDNVYVGTKCLDTYNDIRFTKSDGTTFLPYWIETSDVTAATIWVRFDSIAASPAATAFYMYYGNPGAASYSNGVNTFDKFDDFNGPALDTSIWTQRGGTIAFSGGEIIITGDGTSESKLMMTGASMANNIVIRTRGKSNDDIRLGTSTKVGTGDGRGYNYLVKDNTGAFTFLNDQVAWGSSYDSFIINTYYIMETWHDGSAVESRLNDGAVRSQTWSGRSGYPALSVSPQSGVTCTYSWAFVRTKSPTEPTWSSWGAEEAGLLLYESQGSSIHL